MGIIVHCYALIQVYCMYGRQAEMGMQIKKRNLGMTIIISMYMHISIVLEGLSILQVGTFFRIPENEPCLPI